MPLLKDTTFVCFDCEMTGLDIEEDRIIEVAAVRFTLSSILDRFERLIDPVREISLESQKIHNITPAMVAGKPKIEEILPAFLQFIGKAILVGHGIGFDIEHIARAAERANIPCKLKSLPTIDTLRLARHYGDSPNNSLEQLATHFYIPSEGAHRAMNDVLMNVEVFKRLIFTFRTTEDVFRLLDRPIKMKYMPLGKHKGRPFSEIPLQYLQWAAKLDFDQDLLYSIRLEIKRRNKGKSFTQHANPFMEL